MTRRPALHEHLSVSHLHAGLELLLQDHLVHGGVHLGIVLQSSNDVKIVLKSNQDGFWRLCQK